MALLRRRSKTLNYDWDTLKFAPGAELCYIERS